MSLPDIRHCRPGLSRTLRPQHMVALLALIVAGWVLPTSLVTGTAAAAPPRATAAAGPTLFGAAIYTGGGQSFASAFNASDARYGGLDIYRVFNRTVQTWSTAAAAYGRRPVIVSFRYAPADVLAGREDATLRSWFATAPRAYPIYWSYSHEPEDNIARGEFTAAQYRSAWRHIRAIENSVGHANLRATLILQCYTTNPASGRSWRTYYPGGSVIQALGWDCYNHGESRGVYGNPQTLYHSAIAASHAAGKPWGMAEIGSLLAAGDSTGTGRGAWLTKAANYLSTQGARFVSYFDTKGAKGSDYRLLDPPSQRSWRTQCSAH